MTCEIPFQDLATIYYPANGQSRQRHALPQHPKVPFRKAGHHLVPQVADLQVLESYEMLKPSHLQVFSENRRVVEILNLRFPHPNTA